MTGERVASRTKAVHPEQHGTSRLRGARALLGAALAGVLLLAPGALAQTVVSFLGEELVITRLDGSDSRRVPVGGEVRAVAANPKHAYALLTTGSEVVRVDLQHAVITEQLSLACCGSVLAVSADDRWLVVGAHEAGTGRLSSSSWERGLCPR